MIRQRFDYVIPECFADTVLVEILGFSFPNHSPLNNVSNVLNTIRKTHPSEKVVGIIDSDRGKSEKLLKKALDGFTFVEDKNNIKKFIRENHTILIISPAFEGWIFSNAAMKDIDPADHGFKDVKYFGKVCKSVNAGANQKLKQFLNTLKQKQAPGFAQLKSWICKGAGINENDLES
jgi:hypothetical protein